MNDFTTRAVTAKNFVLFRYRIDIEYEFLRRFCFALFGAFSTNMYYLILLLISHQSHAAITITSVSELMNLDPQHPIVNVNDAHISVDYLRRLIGQKKIHDNNIHQLEISLLESSETTSLLRDDQKWKNVFAGVGHKGMAIPYFNGVKLIYYITGCDDR